MAPRPKEASATDSKRALQVRLAQRAFRERKELKIKDLEARVVELEAQNQTLLTAVQNQHPPSWVPPPPPQSQPCATCAALEADNRRLRVECDILKELAQSASGSAPQETAAVESAELQFGVPQKVEECRHSLKALGGAMATCKYVDSLCDHFYTMASCEDPRLIKRIVLKIIAARYKIMNACETMQQRRHAIEIIEACKDRNRTHISFMYQHTMKEVVEETHTTVDYATTATSSSSANYSTDLDADGVRHLKLPKRQERKELLAKSKAFLDAAKSIPSLQGSSHLVEDLIVMFWCQASCHDKTEREALIFGLVDCFNRLQAVATEKDKADFILATEIAREKEKAVANDMFDLVLSNKAMSGNLLELL
ncbi:hypothetical protein BC830DRAFT_1125678 [Chytriomyces sp. MP71]|nr:hypothetical protein BC830DRAFT_1125678 [Chytriomyces sp. MP71]